MEVWKVVQEERKAVCVADLFLRGDKKIRNVLRIPDVVGDFFLLGKISLLQVVSVTEISGNRYAACAAFPYIGNKKIGSA